MSAPPGRRAAACLSALAALLVVSACGGSDQRGNPDPTRTTPTPTLDLPDVGRYVALGDSYTAGPGIAPGVQGSGLCLRSERNYPSLLARRLGADLTDVSCSGASSVDVVQPGRGLQGDLPAQIDAVTDDTDLVTVGIGANDNAFFDQLLKSCMGGAQPCSSFVEGPAPGLFTALTQQVSLVLEQVTEKAPDADVILVGYPRIVPEERECSTLDVPDGTVPEIRLAESQLDDAMAAAADAAEVTYVSMYQRTGRHDACGGDEAWTNAASVSDGDGILFHPRLLGMRATAEAVASALSP